MVFIFYSLLLLSNLPNQKQEIDPGAKTKVFQFLKH